MFEQVHTELLLDAGAAVAYCALAVMILLQARLSRTGLLLAGACMMTAVWALGGVLGLQYGWSNLAGGLNLLRSAAWYGFILHLYRRSLPPGDTGSRIFVAAGAAIGVWTLAVLIISPAIMADPVSLWSGGIALSLFGALCQLLVLENLYRNTADALRWTLQLTCVALGGLAIYDVALSADALLLHRYAPALVTGRPLVACIVVPLLALAAARNRRWAVGIHISRSAVFYSATLVISGLFLLVLAGFGELVRQFGPLSESQWGGVTQVALLFTGLIVIAVLLVSSSTRARLRALLVDHFFTHRYDYRREWLRCIDTLSSLPTGAPMPLETRVIRTLAQLVDSPAGLLLLRDQDDAALQWAGAWNLPSAPLQLPLQHPLTQRLEQSATAIVLGADPALAISLVAGQHRPAWLAIPLRQGTALSGCVLVAASPASFALDAEVFDLLRTVASEVSTYLAERRAARVLDETRELRAYGERFAFVAHDIKNVASQLSLLLSNAETHIANPEFQRDMLATVQASVDKIGLLIRRLQNPTPERPLDFTLLAHDRLDHLAAAIRRTRRSDLHLEHDGAPAAIMMDAAAFDMVVTHLLDNAIEAGGAASPIVIRTRHESGRIVIDIVDQGCGMSPEFVRDDLFQPFRTSKSGGSGIGAFQARELLRMAGGNLIVLSEPGHGTTMRILLPLAGAVAEAA